MARNVTILGAGAWGTALAHVAHSGGNRVALWARDPARRHGPDHPEIRLTSDLADAVKAADCILLVVPAQANRVVLEALADCSVTCPVLLGAKGIEKESGLLLHDLADALLPNAPVGLLSGPGFSADVLAGKPTAVTIACQDADVTSEMCQVMSGPRFRCYGETDRTGVAAGGALKNVYAIAAGAAFAADLGASAGAALVTRAFAEMVRLGMALGGQRETFNGLSGFGDLVLTCGSDRSRNFRYGAALASRQSQDRALAEGAHSAAVAQALAQEHRIDAPIISATVALIAGETTIEQAVDHLMKRPLKSERDG